MRKENVLVGRLIPAGTGFKSTKDDATESSQYDEFIDDQPGDAAAG